MQVEGKASTLWDHNRSASLACRYVHQVEGYTITFKNTKEVARWEAKQVEG